MNPDNPLTTALPRILLWLRAPIATVSGILATWLTTHVHLLGTFHVDQDSVAGTFTQAIVFLVTTLVTSKAVSDWVTGHHIELEAAWERWNESGQEPGA